MTPKEFEEVNVVMGEGQPEYKPLPAHRNPETGEVIMCFSLSDPAHRLRVYGRLNSGRSYYDPRTNPGRREFGKSNREQRPISGDSAGKLLHT